MDEVEPVERSATTEIEELRLRVAELEQCLSHRTREMVALHEISLEINRQPNLAALLQAIVEKAAGLMNARMGGLYLMQPDGETLELLVGHNLPAGSLGITLQLGEGLSGRVAQTGQLLTVPDYRVWEGRAGVYAGMPFRRVVGVPLKVGDQIIGVINISDDNRSGSFDEAEIRLVSLFADQAALAVDKVRLWEKAQHDLAERYRAEQIQSSLYRISEAAYTASSLDDLYRLIHAIVADLMPARNFGIALYEPTTDMFSFPYRVDEHFPGDLTPAPRRRGKTLVDYVWQTGVPLLGAHAQLEQLVADQHLQPVGEMALDWLGVPLKWQGASIGVMVVQTYTPGEGLTEEHKQILMFVSAQIAMAIQRKRAEQRQASIYRISEAALAAQRPDDLYALIQEIVNELMPAKNFYIALYEAATDTVSFPYFRDEVETVLPVPARQHGSGLTEYVLRLGEPWLGTRAMISDLLAQGLIARAPVGPLAVDWLGVPLKAEGQIIGLIAVQSYSDHIRLTDEHKDLLVFVSTQVAMVIQRKRAEQDLHDSEEKYRILFSNDLVPICLFDGITLQILDVNDAFLRLYDYQRADFLNGLSVRDISAEPDRSAAAVQQATVVGTMFIPLRYHRKKDGTVFPVQLFSGPFLWKGKTVFFTWIQDITDRMRAEDALRDSEERFRNLARNSPDINYIIDLLSFKTLYLNRDDLLGYTMHDLEAPGSIMNAVHPDDVLAVAARWQAILQGEVGGFIEYRLRRKAGEYEWVQSREKILLRDARGQPTQLLVTLSIVTDRHQAEARFRQAQKMESLGILAGGIAHDFNNLLVAMLGQTSLALGQLPEGSAARRPIEKAVLAARRAADLTRQLLAYSGRGQFELRPIHLNQLIQENLHLFDVAVPKNVALRPELTEPLPVILGDAGQIQQVVMNLIINAAEAIGEQTGTVVVRTRPYLIAPDKAALWQIAEADLSPGPYVLLEVEDNGSGMSQETVSKIFDPFFSTKFAGRGLGLAAVLGIVRGHEGGLRVRSEPHVGTAFDLVFPGAEVPSSAAKTPEVIQEADMLQHVILVIDDEAPVREAVVDILEMEGFSVLTAPDGQTGIDLYEARQAEIDLVMLDLSMPGLNGEETFYVLRQIDPQVRIMLSSGYSHDEVTARFAGQHAVAFMQKPYDAEQLVSEVKRHIALPPA